MPGIRSATPVVQYGEANQIMDTICDSIRQLSALARHPHVQVTWSLGAGSWAKIPWIALIDDRETTSTRRGTYCVFLFPEDLSGVYLTLNQGATDIIKEQGRAEGREALASNAERIRSLVVSLRDCGFSSEPRIDLHTDSPLGRDYEYGTVVHKFYEKGAVPSDELVNRDLDALLDAYTVVLESKGSTAQTLRRTWIFQANPNIFDLEGAAAALAEMNWGVNQHRDAVRKNDQVFLWQSGQNAGIVALATVLTDPTEVPQDPAEKPLIRRAGEFEGSQLCVRLRVDRKLNAVLPRSKLMADPRIENVSILRASQGTNFPVTPHEAEAISQMIAAAEAGQHRGRGQRVWIYAPGRNAQYWDEFYRDGILGIGWDKIGDFRQYKTLDEMSRAHTETYELENKPINNALACWEFARSMAPGDLVFARQGLHAIVGHGTVTGDYDWQSQRDHYKSVRTIRWEPKGNWTFEGQFFEAPGLMRAMPPEARLLT
jgi:hypothetical protein